MKGVAGALLIGILVGLMIPRWTSHSARAAAPGPYQQFVGHWFWHSGAINVDQAGHGDMHFRTYVNCTQTIMTDCDYFDKKGYIYGGGFVVFYLWKVQGNKAYGSITNSAYSYQVGTTVTLVRNANDTLSIYSVGATSYQTACGPHAPVSYCGA